MHIAVTQDDVLVAQNLRRQRGVTVAGVLHLRQGMDGHRLRGGGNVDAFVSITSLASPRSASFGRFTLSDPAAGKTTTLL